MKKNFSQVGKLTFGIVLLTAFFFFSTPKIQAQEIVDKTVATVSDGVGTPELITYSDLLWALALQPNVSLNPPSSEDLNAALQLIINQRLIAIEAKRLPGSPSDEEIDNEIMRVLANFPSTAEFEKRLRIVGFDSVKDDNFERMMRERTKIEKYIDFRFRSFVVITPEDEARYYREVFTPDFRKRFPGLLMPSLDEKRADINKILSEEKVASDIESFLDEAKRRADIVILSEV
jgi:parvulin-like peptidyl-prolyl isomerase